MRSMCKVLELIAEIMRKGEWGMGGDTGGEGRGTGRRKGKRNRKRRKRRRRKEQEEDDEDTPVLIIATASVYHKNRVVKQGQR